MKASQRLLLFDSPLSTQIHFRGRRALRLAARECHGAQKRIRKAGRGACAEGSGGKGENEVRSRRYRAR